MTLDGCSWKLKIKLDDKIYYSNGWNAWPGFEINSIVGNGGPSCIDEIIKIEPPP